MRVYQTTFPFLVLLGAELNISWCKKKLDSYVRAGFVHQNPWTKVWFFGPAPDYDKMARQERQVRQWYAL